MAFGGMLDGIRAVQIDPRQGSNQLLNNWVKAAQIKIELKTMKFWRLVTISYTNLEARSYRQGAAHLRDCWGSAG